MYFFARFGKVPRGWIFIGPAARRFGTRDYYLVNDAQRAAILAAAPSLGLLCTYLGLLGIVGAALAVVSIAVFHTVYGRLPTGELEAGLLSVPVLTLAVIAGLAFGVYLNRRLVGIVANFPPSTERIAHQEAAAAFKRAAGGRKGRRLAMALAGTSALMALGVIVFITDNHATLTIRAVLWMIISIRLAYSAIKIYANAEPE